MNNQEAIASLKTLCHTCELFPKCVHEKPECFQAIELAISALHAQEAKNSNESSSTHKALDTISRQAAIDAVSNWLYDTQTTETSDEVLLKLPSVEPERKKGKWTKDCACEICGFKPWYERDIHTLSFCPNCGADMRGDDHDL